MQNDWEVVRRRRLRRKRDTILFRNDKKVYRLEGRFRGEGERKGSRKKDYESEPTPESLKNHIIKSKESIFKKPCQRKNKDGMILA